MASWQDEAKDKIKQGDAKMHEEKGKIEQKASDIKNQSKHRRDGSKTSDNDNASLELS